LIKYEARWRRTSPSYRSWCAENAESRTISGKVTAQYVIERGLGYDEYRADRRLNYQQTFDDPPEISRRSDMKG
jgi:hypothetical protein